MPHFKKATLGNHLPGELVGDQVPLLTPGQCYVCLKMPTKPELVVIPEGYLGVTDMTNGVVTSVSVVAEDSKAAHKAKKHFSAIA